VSFDTKMFHAELATQFSAWGAELGMDGHMAPSLDGDRVNVRLFFATENGAPSYDDRCWASSFGIREAMRMAESDNPAAFRSETYEAMQAMCRALVQPGATYQGSDPGENEARAARVVLGIICPEIWYRVQLDLAKAPRRQRPLRWVRS
jgi:hypothetical protein